MDSFSVHGIWEIDISAGFNAAGTETTGKQTFPPREPFGWERKITIPTVTSWVITGNQDVFGIFLDGTMGTIFARKRE